MKIKTNVYVIISRPLKKEVVRTAKPIDRVSFEIVFTLPMTDPLLSDYKARLDADLFKGESRPKDEPPHIHYDKIYRTGGRTIFASAWLDSAHSLFPTSSEPVARDALAIWVVELAFYRTPIDPKAFDPSRLATFYTGEFPKRLEPDLGIAERFNTSPGLLTIEWHPPESTATNSYQLELRDWEPAKSGWRKNTEQIEYEGDLAGAQMLIDFGGFGRARPEFTNLRAAFQPTRVILRINEKEVAILPQALTRHITEGGYPFWEFRFPSDPSRMFASGQGLK